MTSLPALDLLDLARQQLADLGGELLPDPGPLAFAHPLDDPLLGGLHREPAELHEGNLFLEHVADLEVGVLVLGLLQRDLPARVLDRLHHLAEPHDPDRALQLVHVQLEPDVGAELADQRRLDAVAQQLQQIGALQLFCGRQLAERGQHFGRTCHRSYPKESGRRLPTAAQSTTSVASLIVVERSVVSPTLLRPEHHVLVVGHRHDLHDPLARRAPATAPGRGARRTVASAPASRNGRSSPGEDTSST